MRESDWRKMGEGEKGGVMSKMSNEGERKRGVEGHQLKEDKKRARENEKDGWRVEIRKERGNKRETERCDDVGYKNGETGE